MATIALQLAGTALGGLIGGPIGGSLGSALGGIAGSLIDRAILGSGNPRVIEGPRLSDLDGITASEGAPIPRLYGRARLGGQVIWATEFEEERIVERSGGSGGKAIGGGSRTKTTRYAYYTNVAIGLCEGPISLVRRIWADGKPLDLATLTMRVHLGDEAQAADPLIVAKQESAEIPAFRGLAYIVFERFPLADYGNRLPQFSFEIVRAAGGLNENLRAINIIPGSTEFGYETSEIREDFGYGNSQAVNRTQWTHTSDWDAAIDNLQALAPRLERATLINAWFGDDLRLGQCSLQPRSEKAGKATMPRAWSVAGLTRASALPVSATDGRPNYGGSPDDQSVINALRDLKARGLKVALHPFILMDLPQGNAKPDPYGGVEQAAFPWRGRITCDPAPGRPNSPEGSSAIPSAVASFFGQANAAHFSLSGDQVLYAGPPEWSFRRMVLHQAMLAKAAGGVDTFFIGSEMIGLTHLISGNGVFPGVQQLIALAQQVRILLGPNVRLTYAADWTEYGARVRNGGQDIRFPLDALWGHAEIGAVAVDFYPPVSDWRAGRQHLDALTANSGSEEAYLSARLFSGESFDWFYANAADRTAQIRTPINDGAYNKPWIYRAKDLANWWANPHVERVNGVELAQPTAWVPRAKPILLAEIGCPAVDKGANQPNVFPDPKSSENAFPYFSTGERDDLVQRRLLEAYSRAFDQSVAGHDPARNPNSPLYGGPMVAPDFIAPWAYDARPFPAFPALTEQWADGENWARGHWLNGRIEGFPLDGLIGRILADHGHDPATFHGVDGFVDGYVIDRPMSARGAIEPLLAAFGVSARLEAGSIAFLGPPARISAQFSADDLIAEGRNPRIEITRAQETDLPRNVSLGFVDSERDFRKSVVAARKDDSLARREIAEDTAIVMPQSLARQLVESRLQNVWAGRETFKFVLPPSALALEPGDLLTLETPGGLRLVQISRLTDGKARACEARAFDPALAERIASPRAVPAPPRLPALPGAPFIRFLELPLDRGEAAGPIAALIRAEPWHGPYAIALVRAEGLFEPLAEASLPARIGETISALRPGPLWRWDNANFVEIALQSGALASLSAEAALAGGNAIAFFDAEGLAELCLFQKAELIGSRRYRLSGLVRGLAGSEAAAARLLPAGSFFTILDAAILELGLPWDQIGRSADLIVLPAGRDPGDPSAIRQTVTPAGLALRPLAPVHARARRGADGIDIRFIRRTRRDGDSLDLFEVPLNEEREEYRLEIFSGALLKRKVSLSAPTYLYANADEIADFGAVQSQLSVQIRQISARIGDGAPLIADLPIR